MGTSSGPARETSTLLGRVGAVTSGGSRAHRWLAWAVWLLTLVAVSAVASGVKEASTLEMAEALGWIVGVMAVATLGALVVSRRRSLIQGWLLVIFSMSWAVGLYAYHLIEVPVAAPSSGLDRAQRLIALGDSAYVVAVHALLLLLLLVPNGRLPSKRWRFTVWLLGASAVFWTWQSMTIAHRVVDVEVWLSRATLTSNVGADLTAADQTGFAVGTAVGIVVVVLLARALWGRLRSARGEERQQIKWVFVGSAGVLAWLLVSLPLFDGGWPANLQRLYPGWSFVLLAVGFGMALFRYRLWDVDLVVRRSLVYGVLWLAIAAIYAAVAAGLGLAAGARFPVGVAIALTVAATLVFQPARRSLEQAADRWVFGRRDSPVDAMQSFGEGVAASARPGAVASELATIARSAVGLAWASVEIDGSTGAVTGAVNDESEVAIPIVWNEERLGLLRCLPHRGVRLTADDLALLQALIRQAALALSHARLASRIVHAQEKERRRIERNIHDGAQQDLATLVAQVAVARARADGDASVVEALSRIQRDVQRVLADLRELAQGIHPPVLRDGGLMAAIEDRCSRLPIDVDVQVDGRLTEGRLPAEIEAAAYFFTAEALANTLKHSGSSSVEVTLELDENRLRVAVSDAGVGFDATAERRGSGIAGLSDRIRALGGDLTVQSTPGRGTVVTADLPAAASEMP
ncbi:MAG TPA: GAF domain-containing sensor histidine kinase [Actinomycetes bacterium]|nr:GAF domain-containing sensor histidine kinase [Actinomycetes bacterium]